MTNELKSKAMTLGNKLAPRMGGDRRAAFIQAGAVEVKAAGVSFGRRPVALARLARYNPSQVRAVVVPEPENPADPAALKIMVGVQGGRGLYCAGYIPRQLIPVVQVVRGLPSVQVVLGTQQTALLFHGSIPGSAGPVPPFRRLV
jgi:hypothetical protein